MIQDDRPIKPSEQYLQNINQPNDRIVISHNNYLRRSSGKYLPCFSESRLKATHPQQQSPKNQPTKRQIYERIKSQNEAMYGKQKKKKQHTQIEKWAVQTQQLRKQKAKRIQLFLANKQKVIQTDEEKITSPAVKKVQTKASITQNTKDDQKEKYERLIKQMQKQRQLLKKEREQFEEEKLLLEFRRDIKNQEGLKPKKNFQETKNSDYYQHINKGFAQSSSKKSKPDTSLRSINEPKNNVIEVRRSLSRKRDFKSDLVESKKLIENISQKIIEMESNQKIILERNQSCNLKHPKQKLQLQNLPMLTHFSIDIFDNQNQQILHHTNNKYYRQFLNRQKTLKVVSKEKEGNKEITKYQDGSFIKDVKKYRLVQFPNGYRLTIFQNHDVKQEMPGGMICYYSKARDVNKITYNNSYDIYYFYKEKQIEVHHKPSRRKQIRYKNGIKRTLIDPLILK